MQTFNNGKKVFFLFPPREFSKGVIQKLFRNGYETYVINQNDNLEGLFEEHKGSLLFINTDYPYSVDIEKLSENLKNKCDMTLFAIFYETVNYSENTSDYISLERPEDEIYAQMDEILQKNKAHGKREFVRYGNYNDVLSEITFDSESEGKKVSMHDISPKALSFSSNEDLKGLIGSKLTNMRLTVGAYEITVNGRLESSRNIGGKEIYITVFEADDNKRNEIFDFIYTSLEKGMDEFIKSLD